jgi:hypothetical protein
MAVKSNLRLVAPTTEKQTVAPDMDRRRPNAALRSREHLTADEVERLIAAAKDGRHGHRDATMLLVAYRHACGWECVRAEPASAKKHRAFPFRRR